MQTAKPKVQSSRLPGSLSNSVAAGLLWRYVCHAAMLGLALLNEPRPAPRLPDAVLGAVPFVKWIHDANYRIWVAAQLPVALWLWRRDRAAFVRFLYVGGVLSLLRGLCVPLTVLGPPLGADVNAGLSGGALLSAWLELINPFTSLFGRAAHVYLTKDMFFSGHVATSFLLWLYCRGKGRIAAGALVGHLAVTLTAAMSHIHYAIDFVGAWAVTFSLFALAEGWRPLCISSAREPKPGA